MATESTQELPAFALALQKSFGGPSDAAFGIAVFFVSKQDQGGDPDLEQLALARYRQFCGKTWERFGEENWLSTWSNVYSRSESSPEKVESVLRSLDDRDARLSASMLLEGAATDEAQSALAEACDDSSVSNLSIYKIGDGNAMSGLLIAAQRPEGAIFLAFLLD